MSRRLAPNAAPSLITDADAAYAAAWRFGVTGHPEMFAAFEAAWNAAAQRPDLRPEIAAAAIAFIHQQSATLVDLPRWIERLARIRVPTTAGAAPARRIMLDAAQAVIAMRGDAPVEAGPSAIAERLAVLKEVGDADRVLLAATVLLAYTDLFADDRDYACVEAAGARIESAASPYLRFGWWCFRGQHAFHRMRYDEAVAIYERAAAFVDAPDAHVARSELLLNLAQVALGRGDLPAATALLAEIGPADLARPTASLAATEIMRARAAALEGNFEASKRHARQAAAIAREVNYDALAMSLQIESQAMTAIGDGDLAAELLERHAAVFQGEQAELVTLMAELCRCYAALRGGDAGQARGLLVPAVAKCRRLEFTTMFRYTPGVAARLADAALALGIERDWVRHVIRERQLLAPPGASAEWPWPVRIRALGEFVLEIDGVRVETSGKAQGRPLDALMAMVALGGRRVPLEALLAAVWRGKGRVGTENVWYVTLRRLRDMLGRDDAIVAGQQRVGLAEGIVDLDLWRLEAAIDRAAAHPHDAAAIEAVRAAYRGPLLEGVALPAIESARECLRQRVAATIGSNEPPVR